MVDGQMTEVSCDSVKTVHQKLVLLVPTPGETPPPLPPAEPRPLRPLIPEAGARPRRAGQYSCMKAGFPLVGPGDPS
jgi:hypothetical protein